MKKFIFSILIILYSCILNAQTTNIEFIYQGKEYTGIQILPTDSTYLDVLTTDLDSLFVSIYFNCKEIIISDDTPICHIVTNTGETTYQRFINVRQRKGEFSLRPYFVLEK